MSTDDGDRGVDRVRSHNTRYETTGTNNIKRRHAEDSSWIVNSGLLKDGRDDRNGRVDRIGDYKNVSLRGDAGDRGSKVTDDGSIGLQESL